VTRTDELRLRLLGYAPTDRLWGWLGPGLIALVVFYARLGWAPSPGRLSATLGPPPMVTGFLLIDSLLAGRPAVARDALSHLLLPAAVLATYNLGIVTRLMRGSTLDVLGEDYVRTARAKGLRERLVVLKHALKNAAMPIVTVIGLQFGLLLGGALVCEMIFAWPGVGRLMIFAIYNRDFPLVEAAVFVMAMVFVLGNLLVDLCYAWLDPRVRLSA